MPPPLTITFSGISKEGTKEVRSSCSVITMMSLLLVSNHAETHKFPFPSISQSFLLVGYDCASRVLLCLFCTQLRKINTASFPIVYQERFYEEVVEQNDSDLSKYALWRGTIVGAICTRISHVEQGSPEKKLYIMTLAVSAPYRGRGIGSQLLQSVLDRCPQRRVQEISLHVHVSNRDAIRFYTERFGFDKGQVLENYYRRLNPPHCYLLSKQFDLATTGSTNETPPTAATTAPNAPTKEGGGS